MSRLSRLRQLHPGPGAGVTVVVAGIIAATAPGDGDVSLFLLLALVVVVATVVDAARAAGRDVLRIDRALPGSTTIETPTEVRLRVRNTSARAVHLRLHDSAPLSAGRDPRDHAVEVPARGHAELVGTLVPARRGDLAFGPVTVRARGPWRLGLRQEVHELPATLRVYPRLPGRAEVELRLTGNLALTPGVRRTRLLGQGTEFDSLRDHHPDDDHRRINWPATARAGKPIATVLREERNQHVVLMVDTGRAMAGSVDGVPRMELALDAGIALAEMAARSGDHVSAWAFDRVVRAHQPSRSGRRQPGRILDTLFALEPTLDQSAYGAAFARVLTSNRRRSLLVLVTDIPDVGAIDGLLEALPLLARRHVVLVATLRDPAMAAAVAADLRDADDVHEAAAAAGMLAERRRAARRLTQLGARVVEETPDRLAGALVDAYLDLKRAGRL